MQVFLEGLVKQVVSDLQYVTSKESFEKNIGHPKGPGTSNWFEVSKILRRALERVEAVDPYEYEDEDPCED